MKRSAKTMIRRTASRRSLLAAGVVVACAAALPLVPWLRTWAPRRVVEAIRRHAYPGRLVPLDLADVRRVAPWSG